MEYDNDRTGSPTDLFAGFMNSARDFVILSGKDDRLKVIAFDSVAGCHHALSSD